MKAVIWTKYGSPDGLQLREIPKPVPADHEILVKVHAATASTPDTEFRRLKLPLLFALPLRLYTGLLRPTRIPILGTEFAGEVEAAGRAVSAYRPGDALYGYTGLRMGTYAEYICLSETRAGLASVFGKKPANLTYAEAAAIPFGGMEALHSLRQANIQPGQKVLIIGAGGSIGTCAVQLARHSGAEVTGVDKSGKLAMLRSLGADHVIDYEQQDFTKGDQVYDAILDTVGKTSFTRTLRVLKENGVYLNANPGWLGEARKRLAGKKAGQAVLLWSAGYTASNLQALTELVESGVIRPVIDRSYPLEQAAEAHRYVDTGQKKGNVVLTIPGSHP